MKLRGTSDPGDRVGFGLLCPQQVTGFGIHRIDGCLNVSEVDGISSVSVASNGTNADRGADSTLGLE